jgi:hypothetical protein
LTKLTQDVAYDAVVVHGTTAGASEVTPAMIAAGVDAYLALDRDYDSFERIVTDVYEAMAQAARQPRPVTVSGPQSTRISPW